VGSRDGQQWTLFNIEDGSQYDINRNGLQNPAFSDDNRYIFFESGNDLWKYDVVIKTLIPTKLAPGKTAKIVNVTEYEQSPQSHISVRSFDPKKTVLLEIRDPVQNLTSYNVWKENNTTKEIIPSTNDKIRNIVYDDRMSIFLTLEENYNKAPQLFLRSSAPKKQLLYGGDTADQTASLLKQDIIHYTSGEGLPLKGVLYYPVHYQPNKKYPMVVHIYQIQSDKSNEYFTPSYNNRDGLDIRTLTERGYFVLLPDTAVGPTGAGLSALHCVNKALDAVHTHPNIDMQKVGLVGHSFGGYETNFIATHSNRFAAYISGAGISDIVRSYFSYNYHFAGPYYWQYEHGIFSMLPFSNSKEIYFNNNPIYNIEGINAPILLWTGMKDQNVPWDQTMEFFIGLKRNQKPTIALFYPNGRHALAFDSKEKKNLHTKVLEWWDYFLKNKKNVPWIDRQMKKGA
jgi:dipeptidyl aminopeptidase/acylaminoacyl peptidase